MQQVSRVTVLMSRACLYSFFDELYGEALNAPLCPSPSRQSDHDLTSTEVARWYRSSLEHVAVAGRNDRSIIERHTRREIVRVHVGWNPQRHQRRNTFTLAEHTFFTLSPLRNKLSFRFDTFFFFREKQKFFPAVGEKVVE